VRSQLLRIVTLLVEAPHHLCQCFRCFLVKKLAGEAFNDRFQRTACAQRDRRASACRGFERQ